MRRRDFIGGLGGAAAANAWPQTMRAQQQDRVWRVAVLFASSETDKGATPIFNAFRRKLQDLGYIEGRNLRLDVRRAEGDYTRLPGLAAELVSLVPDVIVGSGVLPIAAAQGATRSIPIVMATIAVDPIGNGFIKSLAKPGGNITGMYALTPDFTAKTVELLHMTVPSAKRIGILTSANPNHAENVKEAEVGARAFGLTLIPAAAPTPADLDNAFEKLREEKCDALIVIADTRVTDKIVSLAEAGRLPAIYQVGEFVDLGGLMSYGANYRDMFQKAAVYVDKILKGADPAVLPVEQPTKFELRINLKTAKALGLTIPVNILVSADEVIE